MNAPHSIRHICTAAALLMMLAAGAQAAPLYSNGAVVDGGGLSVLTAPDSTFGWGAQTSANNMVGDDFTVPVGATWNVSSLSLFAYQTGATAFSFTTATWRILSGDVNTGTVVASGTTAVTNEGQVGYRVLSTQPTNTQRPIFQIGVDIPDQTLTAGDYWLTWMIGGTLASGPWAAPAEADKNPNAVQSINGGAFVTLVDAGSQARSQLAFSVNGTPAITVPEPTSVALVLVAGAAAALSPRRRAA